MYCTIPYHSIWAVWPSFATTSAEANSMLVHSAFPLGMEGWVGSVTKCEWCVATAIFTGSTVRVCTVYEGQ